MPGAILTDRVWVIQLHTEDGKRLDVTVEERTNPPTVNVVAAYRFRPKNLDLLRKARGELKLGRKPLWVELGRAFPEVERNVWALEQAIRLLNGALTE